VRIEGCIAPASGVVLPADASWIVELRDDASGTALAEQRQAPSAPAWPAPFTLRVDAARLHPGRAYSVRAGALVQGRIGWLSPARPVPLGQEASVDVGMLSLWPYRFPGAFTSTLRCGDQEVTLGYVGKRLRLSVGGETFDLDLDHDHDRDRDLDRGVPASAQRFARPGDATTVVVIDEHGASVSVHGRVLAGCVDPGAPSSGARPARR
jgi:hypothetical protein